MIKSLLFVLVLTEVSVVAQDCAPPATTRGRVRSERLPVVGQRIKVLQVRERVHLCPPPPAVAERASRENLAHPATKSVSGVALRVLTAPNKAQMINPLAPPEYGSARGLVEYTQRDPYRTSNENKFAFQQDGIRLLTLRPFW